ncbi:MAG: 2-dehydropantoate 2-reductase [Bacteroidia bacterium]|nr:2-dehydropantoate 2-reductase [Bacteroidia bacterium]
MGNRENTKVGIIGLGPVGMVLAVKLQQAGVDVSLCVRNEVRRNKIINEGIRLENTFNEKATFSNVCEHIEELAALDLDYLVLSVKTYHVPQLIPKIASLNSEKLTIVCAQNGIDTEQLFVPAFGENKIIRMVINFAGIQVNPNTIRVTFFNGPNYIGSINDTKRKEAEHFSALLNKSYLDTVTTDSFGLVKKVWHKTILNSSLSALCGVGRLTMAEAMADPETVELIEQTINEAVLVAEKEKIHFADDFIRECMRYLKKGGDHFPSLAQDLINGRETEIDYFNGKIVAYGKKHYVRASLNLSFTNMVSAMTNKNIVSRIPGVSGDVNRKILSKGLQINPDVITQYKKTNCYLGIDLGSAYTKFVVTDTSGKCLFIYFLPTLNNDKQAFKNVMQTITSHFNIASSCATGYGRKHFSETDIIKTEINCAAAGVSFLFPGEKNIIDIGGEDIKVIRCDKEDNVQNFYMNDKCAAGTGAFLAEIAERASISVAEMSTFASLSNYDKELNSFCTVFAKTEIMNWIFEGMSLEDISRGIYNSITNKIAKMRIDPGIPTYMIGGVIAHHPYLNSILSEKFNMKISTVENSQYTVAYGAAILAQRESERKGKIKSDSKENAEIPLIRK